MSFDEVLAFVKCLNYYYFVLLECFPFFCLFSLLWLNFLFATWRPRRWKLSLDVFLIRINYNCILRISWFRASRLLFQASQMAQIVKNLPAMQATQVWSLGQEDPLEKEMATYSSILAQRILRTEERGLLHSPWGHRVRHDWRTRHSYTWLGWSDIVAE